MNREKKFRTWDKANKRMFLPEIHFSNGNLSGSTRGIILMQYTGLKDKNEKEIFEGDIVLSHPEEGQKKWSDTKGVIVFHDTSYKIEIFSNHPTPPYCLITIFTPEHFGIGLEIIGNIYENPELLNQ